MDGQLSSQCVGRWEIFLYTLKVGEEPSVYPFVFRLNASSLVRE